MAEHFVRLVVEDGELHPAFVCTAAPDADCRRRPEGFENRDDETYSYDEATEPGFDCWASEWVEAAGIVDAIIAGPDRVVASVPVTIAYQEGVEVYFADEDRESSNFEEADRG